MRIQLVSDLHLEFLQPRIPGFLGIEPAPGADVLVIAGDIHTETDAIASFANWPVPVIYVYGNHEMYGHELTSHLERLRRAATGTSIQFLEQDEWIVGDVRFLGCALWTDYEIYGLEQKAGCMEAAESCLLDHRHIRTLSGAFTAQDAADLHQVSRTWLQARLDQPFDGKTVVVTHHAPHAGSIHPRFAGTALNGAFVSDLTPMLEQADLWLHGHMHDSFDYTVSSARIVANPRGYPLKPSFSATSTSAAGSGPAVASLKFENAHFDPALVITI